MDFDKLLITPNIEALDANTQRIRRNLVVTSMLGIITAIGSVDFDNESNRFAGFKLNDIEMNHVYLMLGMSLVYLLIHFIWAAIDSLKENRLRLTGINVPKATVASYAASSTFEPNTNEKRQSSMLSWWKGQKGHYETLERIIDNIQENVKDDKYNPAINATKQHIEELHAKASYIEEALLRYEAGFWNHQRSQIFRWFIMDFGLPCVLACTSLILLAGKLPCVV